MIHFSVHRVRARHVSGLRALCLFVSLLLVLFVGVTRLPAQTLATGEEARLLGAVESVLGMSPSPVQTQTRTPGTTTTGSQTQAGPVRCVTQLLAELALAYDQLSPAGRTRAAAFLARPDDGSGVDFSGAKWSAQGAYNTASTVGSTNFVVHYVSDPVTHPSYVTLAYAQSVSAVMENCHAVQVGTLGWQAPYSDAARPNNGGDGRYDVYLSNVGSLPGGGVFGYTAPEAYVAGAPGVAAISYLVLDNDYSNAEFGAGNPVDFLKVTAAHEYNHSLQFVYNATDYSGDLAWFYEVTATWMEDQVYGTINDYLRYVDNFLDEPHRSLRNFNASGGLRPYGAAIWGHYMSTRHGAVVVRRAWEATATGGSAHPSIHQGLKTALTNAGSSLADGYGEFAAWMVLTGGRQTPGYFADGGLWPEVFIPSAQQHSAYPVTGPGTPPNPPASYGATHVWLDGFGSAPVRLVFSFTGGGSTTPWRLWRVARRAGSVEMAQVALSGASATATVESAQECDWVVFAISNVTDSGGIDVTQPFAYSAALESTLSAGTDWLLFY